MPTVQHNSRPTSQDGARRLLILKHVVVQALTAPPQPVIETLRNRWSPEEYEKFLRGAEAQRDKVCQSLVAAGVWDYVSPYEQELFQATIVTITERQRMSASWRLESVQVLMWALKMLAELPPYEGSAKPEILRSIPSNFSQWIPTAQLRPQSEIDAARDTAELWHWRSRTRQIIERGDAFPASEKMKAAGFTSFDDIVRTTAAKAAEDGIIPASIDGDFPAMGRAYRDLNQSEWSEVRSITTERHFALNWLCGYAPGNQWDETPTGT